MTFYTSYGYLPNPAYIHPIYPAHSPGSVTCFGSYEEEVSFWQGTPIININATVASNFTDEDEVKGFYATLKYTDKKMSMYSDRCKWGPGGLYLQYIGTSSTIRDLVALGDKIVGPGEPINYWGFSYGTVLGFHFVNSEHILHVTGPVDRLFLVFPDVGDPSSIGTFC